MVVKIGSGRAITEFSSAGAWWSEVVESEGPCHVGQVRIEAGGTVGMHPATIDQAFIVVAGSGWIREHDHDREAVTVGDVALWPAGRRHASGSDVGMTAIVVQAESLDVRTG